MTVCLTPYMKCTDAWYCTSTQYYKRFLLYSPVYNVRVCPIIQRPNDMLVFLHIVWMLVLHIMRVEVIHRISCVMAEISVTLIWIQSINWSIYHCTDGIRVTNETSITMTTYPVPLKMAVKAIKATTLPVLKTPAILKMAINMIIAPPPPPPPPPLPAY